MYQDFGCQSAKNENPLKSLSWPGLATRLLKTAHSRTSLTRTSRTRQTPLTSRPQALTSLPSLATQSHLLASPSLLISRIVRFVIWQENSTNKYVYGHGYTTTCVKLVNLVKTTYCHKPSGAPALTMMMMMMMSIMLTLGVCWGRRTLVLCPVDIYRAARSLGDHCWLLIFNCCCGLLIIIELGFCCWLYFVSNTFYFLFVIVDCYCTLDLVFLYWISIGEC